MSSLTVNVKALYITFIFWVILLSSFFGSLGLNCSFVDELFVISLLPLVIGTYRVYRDLFEVWCLLAFFCVYVLISSFFSNYFRGVKLSALDLFLFLKPILLVLAFFYMANYTKFKVHSYISFSGAIFLVVAVAFYPVNLVFELYPAFDYRLGMGSYSFIFANPGEFLNVLIVLAVAVYTFPRVWARRTVVGAALFLMATTLRFKGFVMIGFIVLVVAIFKFSRSNKKLYGGTTLIEIKKMFPVSRLVIVGLVSLIPGWFQFQTYFLGEMTPRLFLVIKGFSLAVENFPVGVGAGTFGSAVSKMYYSPIYFDLGFENRYGLSSDETNFLSDNYWPMVVAQYGFVGLCLTLLVYAALVRCLLRRFDCSGYSTCGFIIMATSLLLSTLGSAILIGSIGCLYMILIASFTRSSKYGVI